MLNFWCCLKELEEVYRQTSDFIKDALDSVENNDIEKAQSLIERHKEINNMERILRKTHIKRLNKGECQHKLGSTLSTSFPTTLVYLTTPWTLLKRSSLNKFNW